MHMLLNRYFSQGTKRNGFTIVELLIVVVVIAILAAVVIVGYNGVQASARDKSLMSDIDAVEAELARFATKNGGMYTSALNWQSSSGPNSNIAFTPSPGNVVVVSIRDGAYCVKAYNPASGANTLQTAKNKGSDMFACYDGWKKIASGGNNNFSGGTACGIATNNRGYCWGVGAIGDGTSNTRTVPTAISQGAMPSLTIKDITVGAQHACAIAQDNLAYCWSNTGSQGSLGNGEAMPALSPTPLEGGALAGRAIADIDAGGYSSCAVTTDGLPYCWGEMEGGASFPVPISTSGVLAGKVLNKISIGPWGSGQHACALSTEGLAYCWENGTAGQLGNGGTSSSSTPVAVSMTGPLAGKTFKAIATGGTFSCAIASDDKVYCWGSANYLGSGSVSNRSTPFPVSGPLASATVVSIDAGIWHTCAATSTGDTYCWGDNGSSQLGDGTTTTRTSPVQVPLVGALSGKKVLKVAPGKDFTCVVTVDLAGSCWGNGSSGRLGNGGTASSTTPVPVTMPTL